MDLIGLTGGIASGKSTVARMLRDAGVDVIDADLLAREAVAPGSDGLAAIVERFGEVVLLADGPLDRTKLGGIVFGDDDARRDLNLIVHPRVGALSAERTQALAELGRARAVYEVPLLFENGLDAAMVATILVAVPEDVQLRRLIDRDGLDDQDARARVAAQMSLADKRARATWTIENGGPLQETAAQLREVWRAISDEDVVFSPPS
jgi:dephospho-CoA kinase